MDYHVLVQEYFEIIYKLQRSPSESQRRMISHGELCILSYLQKHDGHALP